ncbi:MAG: phosphate signaling complex protein PhoU [Candidatus Margulisiibacteriota bacterium]
MTHFQRELDKIKKLLLSLCSLVEENVFLSTQALKNLDLDLAQKIIQKDHEIDQMEITVEEECLKILALYQPVASDLRFLIAILKINNDLERIGDLAVNIAKKIKYLPIASENISVMFPEIIDQVLLMLKKSLDSFVQSDADLAREVCELDEKVDKLKRKMGKKIILEIKANPENIEALLAVLNISKHLERIADLSTNIAEDIIYIVEGEITRHKTGMFEKK